MADAAAAQPNIEEALANNDNVKRSTNLPLFYGMPGKDTATARMMIDRINHAATIAGWNDRRKCSELYLILRDRAMLWFNALAAREVMRGAHGNTRQVHMSLLLYLRHGGTRRTTGDGRRS